MIRSMTGFGKGEAVFKDGKISVEIKTVNHKFFDASVRLPSSISGFEDPIKEMLQKKIQRGKLYLNIACDAALLKSNTISINYKIAKNYRDELLRLAKTLSLKGDVCLTDIIALPGVVNNEAAEENVTKLWPRVKVALDNALHSLVIDREKEGKALCIDIEKRAKKINDMLRVIKSRAHLNVEEYRKNFAKRVKDLAAGRAIDKGRLEIETAVFAKNCDISEEITRLDNHLSNLRKAITGKGEIGKKLDFIAQELHRETNTIGSKANDFPISKNVIEIKGEIEKIREQAKNLE